MEDGQVISVNKYKKYVDGTNTMSYMVNVDNSGLLFHDDDEVAKNYTIRGKVFQDVRVFIPHDIKVADSKKREIREIEGGNFVMVLDRENSQLVIEGKEYVLNDYNILEFHLREPTDTLIISS